jgi:hypothetical protein
MREIHLPRIIDYSIVLEQMQGQQLACLYHNSGAFGFAKETQPQVVGWIGPPDGTIRAQAKLQCVQVCDPHEKNMARLLSRVWREQLGERIWVMPLSHWSYELDFGSRDWMPIALEQIKIDEKDLIQLNNAAAIEFEPHEAEQLEEFAAALLELLRASDFAVAFPGQPILCTIHHHKQLWWQTTNGDFAQVLRTLPAKLG